MSGQSLGLAIITMAVMSIYWACGLNDPKYVNYVEEEGVAPAPTLTECEQAALALFTDNVNGILLASCRTSGCHASQTIAGGTLSASTPLDNLKIMKNYMGTDPTIMTTKFTSGHNGGNLSTTLSEDTLSLWTTKQAECDAE